MDYRSAKITAHISPQDHQQKYGEYLKRGFDRIGLKLDINQKDADIHICIGPHYALKECLGKKTIYIDRCLWGDDFDYVTIGWLSPNGGMLYPGWAPDDRPKPELKSWIETESKKVTYLFDYGLYPEEYKRAAKHYKNIQIRFHPVWQKDQPPLMEHLGDSHLVIGHRTSALATAVIAGYPVVCLDSRCSVYPVAGHDILDIRRPDRRAWLNNMSYAQWSRHEIESGEAIKYVIDSYNSPNCRADNA